MLVSLPSGGVIPEKLETIEMQNRFVTMTVLLTIMVSSIFATAGDKKNATKATGTPTQATRDFLIGPDDVLSINVWKEQDLTRTVVVRPDGKISLPLVGELTASDKTPASLQEEIRQSLLKYIAKPDVTVMVQEVHSQRYNVIGEVQRPGTFALSGPTTVMDGIANAGGFRDFAKTAKIYVLRITADKQQVRLPFNYKEVVKGSIDQNILLQARDTIVIP